MRLTFQPLIRAKLTAATRSESVASSTLSPSSSTYCKMHHNPQVTSLRDNPPWSKVFPNRTYHQLMVNNRKDDQNKTYTMIRGRWVRSMSSPTRCTIIDISSVKLSDPGTTKSTTHFNNSINDKIKTLHWLQMISRKHINAQAVDNQYKTDHTNIGIKG